MFAVKPLSSLKSNLSVASLRRPPIVPGLGANVRRIRKPKVNGGGSIRAVISSGDQAVETDAVKGNGLPYSPSSNSNTVDLKVVLTVRKKIKQRLVDKIEDQFESFINGIGRGISLQLVGEEIDPGESLNRSVILSTAEKHHDFGRTRRKNNRSNATYQCIVPRCDLRFQLLVSFIVDQFPLTLFVLFLAILFSNI